MKTILAAALLLIPAASSDELGALYASMSTEQFEQIDAMCEADLRAALASNGKTSSKLFDALERHKAPKAVRMIVARQCSSFANGAVFGMSLDD